MGLSCLEERRKGPVQQLNRGLNCVGPYSLCTGFSGDLDEVGSQAGCFTEEGYERTLCRKIICLATVLKTDRSQSKNHGNQLEGYCNKPGRRNKRNDKRKKGIEGKNR